MMIAIGKANISHVVHTDSVINEHFLGLFSGKLSQIEGFINYKMMNGMRCSEKEAKPLHGVTPPWRKYLHLLYHIAVFYVAIIMHVR